VDTSYQGPAVWKGAWGRNILHMVLSFSVVSLLLNVHIYHFRGSPSHSAGPGIGTALLVGRSRDRFPVVSVTGDFSRSY
jgi:hypothetical protein